MLSFVFLHIDTPVLANHQKLTISSSGWTLDAVKTILKRWWPIGMAWKRVSRESMLIVCLDDDGDDDDTSIILTENSIHFIVCIVDAFFFWWLKKIIVQFYTSIILTEKQLNLPFFLHLVKKINKKIMKHVKRIIFWLGSRCYWKQKNTLEASLLPGQSVCLSVSPQLCCTQLVGWLWLGILTDSADTQEAQAEKVHMRIHFNIDFLSEQIYE